MARNHETALLHLVNADRRNRLQVGPKK